MYDYAPVDSDVHKNANAVEESCYARSAVDGYIIVATTVRRGISKSVRGEECHESTVGRRFTESRVVGMSFKKAARGEECNESTVGSSDTRDFSVKIKRGNHTLYAEGYNMQAVEQAKWGSYEKAAWGIHSTQITAEEEKIVENHVEDHTTEIEGECYCQETIAMSASTAAHAFMQGCTTVKGITVEKQSWEARYYDIPGGGHASIQVLKPVEVHTTTKPVGHLPITEPVGDLSTAYTNTNPTTEDLLGTIRVHV